MQKSTQIQNSRGPDPLLSPQQVSAASHQQATQRPKLPSHPSSPYIYRNQAAAAGNQQYSSAQQPAIQFRTATNSTVPYSNHYQKPTHKGTPCPQADMRSNNEQTHAQLQPVPPNCNRTWFPPPLVASAHGCTSPSSSDQSSYTLSPLDASKPSVEIVVLHFKQSSCTHHLGCATILATIEKMHAMLFAALCAQGYRAALLAAAALAALTMAMTCKRIEGHAFTAYQTSPQATRQHPTTKTNQQQQPRQAAGSQKHQSTYSSAATSSSGNAHHQ